MKDPQVREEQLARERRLDWMANTWRRALYDARMKAGPRRAKQGELLPEKTLPES